MNPLTFCLVVLAFLLIFVLSETVDKIQARVNVIEFQLAEKAKAHP